MDDDPKKYESIKYFVSISGFALDILILIYLLLYGSVRIRDVAGLTTIAETPDR